MSDRGLTPQACTCCTAMSVTLYSLLGLCWECWEIKARTGRVPYWRAPLVRAARPDPDELCPHCDAELVAENGTAMCYRCGPVDVGAVEPRGDRGGEQ